MLDKLFVVGLEKGMSKGKDTASRRSEEALRRIASELDIWNRIPEMILTVPDEGMYSKVLAIILEAMESKFGVFGYIDEHGGLAVPTMTRTVWDKCQVADKKHVFPRETWGESSWPSAIRQKRTIFSNEPSTNTPDGHIIITRHISMPLIHQGEVVGLIQVANKASDYTKENVILLETVGRTIAPVLDARHKRERLEVAHKQAEEALIASELRYHHLFEAAKDGILILDAISGQIMDVNPFLINLLGFTREEFCGKKIWEIGLFQDLVANEAKFSELQRMGYVRYEDLPLRTRAGGQIDVEFVSNVYEIDHRKVIQCIIRDITERKKAEALLRVRTAHLEVVNQELESFSYSVSHDLRAPLRAIDGFSNALMDDYSAKLDDEGKEYINRVRAGAQRMGVLIDDMLKLAHVSRVEMRSVEVDLTTMARAIAGELKASNPDRNVDFVIAEGLKVVGDPGLVNVLLTDLLGNAWKFTGKHETARVEVGKELKDGHIVFFVKDDGAGFDMTYVGKLFTPFHRLHASDEFPGTGIGLATVQRIVHRHGGRVWAEGGIEKGATIYFTFHEHEGLGKEGKG